MVSGRRSLLVPVFFFMILWTAFTILFVTWGTMLNWPDYVHINYGIPFVWATHTLNTIAGPTDIWHVNLSALVMDLLLWLGLMAATVTVMLYVPGRNLAKAESSS